jgi:DNA invertase Pin-like site-specific DNA recombinase
MTENKTRAEVISQIKDVRARAIDHTRRARQLARQRAELMQELIDDGMSQAEIARELGVSRQAIQKVMSM